MEYPHDPLRNARWKALRRKIAAAEEGERYRLLRYFGDEIRALASRVVKLSGDAWDINVTLELATAQGTVFGGWLTTEPANPDWPGRDRFFLARPGDLLSCCCGLSVLGFFPADQVAAIADAASEAGREAVVPGLEAPCRPTAEIAALAWESAIESARSKRRWRDYLGKDAGRDWAAPEWRDSPATWRTCVILDGADAGADICRNLPTRGGDKPAGLSTLVTVPRSGTAAAVDEWRKAGWDALSIVRCDCLGLYDALSAPDGHEPRAIIIGVGQTPAPSSRTERRSREPTLLGELSDEQFNAIMGESLQF